YVVQPRDLPFVGNTLWFAEAFCGLIMNADREIEFRIKTLTAEDTDKASELFHSFQVDDGIRDPTKASDEYLKRILSKADFHVIAASVDKTIVGGLVAYELLKYKDESAEMYLFEMGVDASFQRRGIGTALIEKLKDICREKGITEMFVGALDDNMPAKALYKSTGGSEEKVSEFTYQIEP
ncbi:MAG: GNAT family N-acetyltransferase, partial [Acidobacteria bacterium]|nr:GNAT family N-acetyltransferase [Acidobacteriota bacterium]